MPSFRLMAPALELSVLQTSVACAGDGGKVFVYGSTGTFHTGPSEDEAPFEASLTWEE